MTAKSWTAARALVESIFHPVISVSDMDTAVGFFGGILGLRQTFDDMHDQAAIARLFGFEAPVVRSVVFECADRTEFELVEFRQPRGRTSTDREMNDAGIAALALRVTGLDRLVGCRRSGRLQAAFRHRRADIARWGDSPGRCVHRAGQGQDHPCRASAREEEPGERVNGNILL